MLLAHILIWRIPYEKLVILTLSVGRRTHRILNEVLMRIVYPCDTLPIGILVLGGRHFYCAKKNFILC